MTPITNSKINFLIIAFLALLTAFSSHANPAPHAYSYVSPQAATDEQGRLLWREAYHPYSSRLLFQSPIKTITALASSSAPSRTHCTVFLTTSLPPCSPFPCELESIQDYGTNDRWFTGKPYEEDTGLSYFGARSYDPLLGRFMGVDPQGFDEKNLHSFNRYAYGNNNPYKYVDPDGEAAILLWAFGGALFLHDVLAPPQPVPGHPGAINSVITIPGPLGTIGASAKVGASAAKEALQHGEGVAKGVGIIAKNGTEITGLTKHGVDRVIGDGAKRAGTKPDAILDAFKNPTKIKEGVDSQGRPFKIYTGENARVVINPETGKIVSTNPLSREGAHLP